LAVRVLGVVTAGTVVVLLASGVSAVGVFVGLSPVVGRMVMT
jgi:hypothetical protein